MPSEDSEGNTVIMSKLSEKNESVAAMHFFCRHDDERRQAGFAVHAVLACMHSSCRSLSHCLHRAVLEGKESNLVKDALDGSSRS